MKPAEYVVADLASAVDPWSGGGVVHVTEARVDVPIETRLQRDGALWLSLPRGQLATGFDPPLGRLVLRFSSSTEEEMP